nr:MAG: acetyltransferase [Pseudomonadota bacterium]
MTRYFAFNGDADGLCALQQLRLSEPGAATLITGVKRDIALLDRVPAGAGDTCTVLDVSLDTNRKGLVRLLEAGVSGRHFDHHFAGELPNHPGLTAHIDPSPTVCTSLLVDRYLEGRHRAWALTGAYGDNLTEVAEELARASGFDEAARAELRALGVCLNYNAYGETIADLHVPPAELSEQMQGYADPLEFARASSTYRALRDGYRDDMERARRVEPRSAKPGALLFVLPNEPWARRASGVLANDLAKAHAASAVALVYPKSTGGFMVSLRVPSDAKVTADTFCRRFPTGGGRRTAAGINDLPDSELERFAQDFEQHYASA